MLAAERFDLIGIDQPQRQADFIETGHRKRADIRAGMRNGEVATDHIACGFGDFL